MAHAKSAATLVLSGISALVAGSVLIPRFWDRLDSGYAEAIRHMRQHAPTDRQVLHAWPKGVCPSGYVHEPNMFELGKGHWDGCYKPGSWTPTLNKQTRLMELRGSIDFLLCSEIMHTPVALVPLLKERKTTTTHQE